MRGPKGVVTALPRVFDPAIMEHFDIVEVLLVVDNATTVIPEIFEIFGAEKGIEFLDVFSGQKIDVPSVAKLARTIRRAMMYGEMRKRGRLNDPENAELVAARFRTDATEVLDACRRVDAVMKVVKRDRRTR